MAGNSYETGRLNLPFVGICTFGKYPYQPDWDAIDADVATSRHAEPVRFSVTVSGDKLGGEEGNHMENLAVTFHVEFPEGAEGDKARAILPRAVRLSHDRLCTVSRTVERGTPVRSTIEDV